MPAPSTPYLISPKQQTAVLRFVQNCVETLAQTWNLRESFLLRDQLYYREIDRTVEQSRALSANLAGDIMKMQNMTVPIIMPQVESALAYLAGVYLTGYPIFGIASNKDNADKALQMETVIADNSVYYGWPRQLIHFMRNGLKYNLGAIEVAWKRKKIYTLVDDPGSKEGKKQELYYEGNCLRNLDPYNLIWDKRVVNPSDLHTEGEFAGYTELMSRIKLKQFLLDLDNSFTMNGREAFESGTPSVTINGSDSWYYIPQVNPMNFINANTMPTTNWLAYAMLDGTNNNGRGIQYNNMYEVTTLYARIIPSDFTLSVPQRNQPQIWKFIVVNRRIVVYVERLTNAHNYLPILLCQPTEDGLGYQTKSFLDNAIPFQFLSSSFWTAAIESKRREVFDRMLYDPSRVRKEDIDKATSVARIPVKQSAYGKPVGDAVYHFPYNGQAAGDTLSLSQSLAEMADIANGQNRVQRGQFQKGNKTRQEFDTTMTNSNARQVLQAMLLEHQTFGPMKEMLKYNMLQYQPATKLYNTSQKQEVTINPQDIRSLSAQFKVSDGVLPTDKLLSTDLLQVFFQTIQTSPMMEAEFDAVGAFVYWCKTQGAQWLDDFKRTPDERDKILKQITAAQAASKAPPATPAPGTAPAGGTT